MSDDSLTAPLKVVLFIYTLNITTTSKFIETANICVFQGVTYVWHSWANFSISFERLQMLL